MQPPAFRTSHRALLWRGATSQKRANDVRWAAPEHLDRRTRALISVTITASLGVLEPLRGQLRIALNIGVTKEEIVEAFIQMAVYADVARAFDRYANAREVFAELTP
jgi:4-carboxymuconolactone decarboxylase